MNSNQRLSIIVMLVNLLQIIFIFGITSHAVFTLGHSPWWFAGVAFLYVLTHCGTRNEKDAS